MNTDSIFMYKMTDIIFTHRGYRVVFDPEHGSYGVRVTSPCNITHVICGQTELEAIGKAFNFIEYQLAETC